MDLNSKESNGNLFDNPIMILYSCARFPNRLYGKKLSKNFSVFFAVITTKPSVNPVKRLGKFFLAFAVI